MEFQRTEHFDRLTLDNLKNYQPHQIPGVLQETTTYLDSLIHQHLKRTKNHLLFSFIFDRITKPYSLIKSRPLVLLIDMAPTNTSILLTLGNKLGKFYEAIAPRTKSQDIILKDNTAVKMYLIATADNFSTYNPGDLLSVNRHNGQLIHIEASRVGAYAQNPAGDAA